MVQEPIYLDLSSSDDDDEDHRDNSAGSTLLCLAKVFHMDVDDDDVRIIDKPASNGKVKRDKARVVRTTLDDDDCCILDTDPGADAAPDIVSSLNTDELVMTGEKGPVACRDFPHARYLCVHFPFKSTLHAKFCAQCHCYVCDSLAPCSLWGDGNSPNDHCHASEEPRWKSLRKIAKYGSVTSLAAPTTTGAADPTGGSRFIRTTLLQTPPLCTPPITPSPVDPLGVPRVATPAKRDPLIIQLKGKGRGKVSQPPHLGVRSVRHHKTSLRKSIPGSLFPSLPRPISPPSGRTQDGAPLPTAAQSPHTPPNPNFRLGRAGGGVPATAPPHPRSIPSLNTLPNRGGVVAASHSHPRPMHGHHPPPGRAGGVAMTQPTVHLPHPTLYPNSAPYYSGVSAAPYIPPPLVTNDVLQAAGAEAPSVPGFVSGGHLIPDRRYVSASPLRDQHVFIDQLPEDHTSSQLHWPSVVTGSDFVAQDSRTPVDSAQNASSSHGFSSRGTVDILAGPIEGWELDAAAPFDDSFAAGMLAGGSPEHGATSLNDVIQQMAADDYLWEAYPGWQ